MDSVAESQQRVVRLSSLQGETEIESTSTRTRIRPSHRGKPNKTPADRLSLDMSVLGQVRAPKKKNNDNNK